MFNVDTKEAILPKIPTPLGKEVIVRCFVGADLACENLIRRSRTGFIIFIQMIPIY